eukprot:Em0007g1250a
MMDQVLQGLETWSAAYIDDVVVQGATCEHITALAAVLKRLREAGLTAKPSKCHFGMDECTYLGHIVENGHVRPEKGKTDASDCGDGAVLSQKDDDDNEHPVAYFSKKLLPRERRYSTIEKKCLAIKLATHAFRVYLLGKPFTVQTDHHALEWLDQLKEDRWSLALQPYQFTVKYRPGKLNGNADALSRQASLSPEEE